MSRPGLVLTVWVVVLWALLFAVFGYVDRQKGEPQWTPPISDWKVNVSWPSS